MIDITEQVLEIVKDVVGYSCRIWPQDRIKPPAAIVDLVGRMVEQVDDDGTEVRTRLTYSVGILATKPSEASSLASAVADAMALYNFHTTGFSTVYEEPNRLYRVNMTLDGAVDRRGHTFQ